MPLKLSEYSTFSSRHRSSSADGDFRRFSPKTRRNLLFLPSFVVFKIMENNIYMKMKTDITGPMFGKGKHHTYPNCLDLRVFPYLVLQGTVSRQFYQRIARKVGQMLNFFVIYLTISKLCNYFDRQFSVVQVEIVQSGGAESENETRCLGRFIDQTQNIF